MINITVVTQLPSLTYPLISLNLVVNTINSDIPFEPALSGPGEIISWEMVGQLPLECNLILQQVFFWNSTELWSTANYNKLTILVDLLISHSVLPLLIKFQMKLGIQM